MVTQLARRYERDGQIFDSVLYPPPGELFDIGGRKIHVQKQGNSGVPVILEAGISASVLSWRLVDQEIAKFATVYSYDRAGLGWSPANDRPKVARELVEEMRLAMQAAGVPTPRIVVGHSFGGMMMRMYAAMYPEEVTGVVLVDALPAEEWFPLDERRTMTLRKAVGLARRGVWLADHGVVRFSLRALERGNRALPKFLSFLSGGGKLGLTQRVTAQIEKFPVAIRGQIRANWSKPSSFRTMMEYLADLPASCAQAMVCPDLGDMPLIVLSAEYGQPGHQGRQAKMAKLSSRGDFRVIAGSTHWLMLDAPEAVIEAVREVAGA